MKVGIAKPEWGIRGGFELVLDRLVAHLADAGHEVVWLTVDVTQPIERAFGLEIPPDVRDGAFEYFRYLTMVERFGGLDASAADVVVTTQPGSWAVPHDRRLALFYHHLRVYYDLSDDYVAAGFVDGSIHVVCAEEVRLVDGPLLDGVAHYLVPSVEVGDRLAAYSAVGGDRCSPFLAGLSFAADRDVEPRPSTGAGPVLCVSRHEWPKRTELAVALAHHLPDTEIVLVGSGGRLRHLHAIDAQLRDAGGTELDGRDLWLPARTLEPPEGYAPSPNLRLLGHVDAAELDRLFASAACVVAPAYKEDYGLTVIEAMAYGKPVIVCADGGGLVDTVQDGASGLVVEPSAASIAAAVRRIQHEDGLASQLSQGALARAAEYSWARALAQFDEGLERAAS